MRRILVVDDDVLIGQAIHAWLKQRGYRVSTAGSGAEGLALLERSAFDLLVVDVFMPNMRGFESIRVFHERAPRIPLIAISGGAFGDPRTTNPDLSALGAIAGALCEPRGGDGVIRKDLIREDLRSKSETQGARAN
jgi:CheY-like chemotaxis protein